MGASFESIERSLHFINKQAEEFARAKSQRVYLEEFRKVQKAILMNEAEQEGRKTGQERESYAYSHPEYKKLLGGLREAIEIEESLRWKLLSARENIDVQKQKNMMSMSEAKLR
ncbi:hypothetical protein NVP1247A_54 [Vibrio phage 1.247.A._10N.261.54.E12]|nr:hypothetical protein NVP1247A_54 [Vibrio phage 1.247.A._10N.261.54.E12]AUR98198.1 hypothetical protein NVP1247B_54 [Vibrio phage 1.247.B._10N.261.54.E12]